MQKQGDMLVEDANMSPRIYRSHAISHVSVLQEKFSTSGMEGIYNSHKEDCSGN